MTQDSVNRLSDAQTVPRPAAMTTKSKTPPVNFINCTGNGDAFHFCNGSLMIIRKIRRYPYLMQVVDASQSHPGNPVAKQLGLCQYMYIMLNHQRLFVSVSAYHALRHCFGICSCSSGGGCLPSEKDWCGQDTMEHASIELQGKFLIHGWSFTAHRLRWL